MPEGSSRDRLIASINLVDNYNRGWVAEALVADALDAEMVGEGYGEYDLNYCYKRIEVKFAGFVQSWPQNAPSTISFGIAECFHDQNAGNSAIGVEGNRRSDAYVFCLHQRTVPDDPTEWCFYVVSTERIDSECGAQKTIALGSLLRRLSPRVSDFSQLRGAVDGALGLSSRPV